MGNTRIWLFGVVLVLFCTIAVGAASVDIAPTSQGQDIAADSGHDFVVTDVNASAAVEGESLTVTAVVANTGNATGEQAVDLDVAEIGTNSTQVELGPGQNATVELTVETAIGDAAGSPYTATVQTGSSNMTTEASVVLPAVSGDATPADLYGNGLYEDVDGSGSVGIFDVQVLFSNINSPAVQDHPWAYNFDGEEPPTVNVFDVQALFGILSAPPPEPGYFTVDIVDAPTTVQQGETIAVSFEVENTDDQAATQDIEFLVGGQQEAVLTDETLEPGATLTDTFTYETDMNDTGDPLSLTVSTDDEQATTAVDVLGPANFQVELTDVPDSVSPGDQIAVDFTVENTGDEAATQDIAFLVDGQQEDLLPDEQLQPGDNVSDTFTYPTGAGDAGQTVSVAVSTDNDTASADVPILEPASFDVTLTNVPAEVTAGEDLVVEYEVENTGGQTDTQDIEFLVDSQQEAVLPDQTLDGGNVLADQFTYTPGESDVGETLSVAVSTEDDQASADVNVTGSSFFDVSITDAPAGVRGGEDIVVDFTVENTGSISGTQDVAFLVDGQQEDALTGQTLAPDATLSDTFTYTTTSGQVGQDLTVEVRTDDDSAQRTIPVNATELVASLSNETASVGQTVTVGLDVTSVVATEQAVDAYDLAIQFDTDVLEFQSVGGGAFGSPFDSNANNGVLQTVDVGNDADTPLEPMIEIEFEVVGSGQSDLAFVTDEQQSWGNEINGPNGYTYATRFVDGSVDAGS